MAQYKVPQDVEADDKLLGPFSFRQFIYLLIAGGLIALAIGLFQIFPLLAIIPLPPILLFLVLALPLKKDQPMETYLSALISYYLKPRTRIWTPGQKEALINITAPKIVEESRTRDISGEEATHRLSFLAEIVDTEGYAIKGVGNGVVNEDLVEEANNTEDIFETRTFDNLEQTIVKDENTRREKVIDEMKQAIEKNDNINAEIELKTPTEEVVEKYEKPDFSSESVVVPEVPVEEEVVEKTNKINQDLEEKNEEKPANSSIIELANNADFSVATIEKEANRIKEKEGEVFISLH